MAKMVNATFPWLFTPPLPPPPPPVVWYTNVQFATFSIYLLRICSCFACVY